MDPIFDYVHYLMNLKYDDLPESVIALIKQDFLDFCGNLLAGSSDPTVCTTAEYFEALGGKEECAVLTRGTRLPAINAGLINSAMGFAMDYDDTHMQGGHIGVTVFPAGLAISEMKGPVDGKTFIAAIAGGMELIVRLGVYNKRRVPRHIFGGWCYQTVHAGFSSAATAGKLLGLTEEQLLDAMGLAYHQAAGTGLSALEHADTKLLGPGFATRCGLTSVFLAQKGITGAHSVLSGDYGMGRMYHNGLDEKGFTDKLGEKYELLDMGFKPYASCRLGHRILAAVKDLVVENGIKADEVERVEIVTCERVAEQLYFPPEETKNPTVRTAAVFSLPWVVSCMLKYGQVGVAQLSDEALKNEGIHALAQKVFVEVDKSVDPADHACPLPVTIKTSCGSFSKCINPTAPGDKGNRIPQKALEEKFFDNASHAKKPLGTERLNAILAAADNLENCKDIAQIVQLLA